MTANSLNSAFASRSLPRAPSGGMRPIDHPRLCKAIKTTKVRHNLQNLETQVSDLCLLDIRRTRLLRCMRQVERPVLQTIWVVSRAVAAIIGIRPIRRRQSAIAGVRRWRLQ